MRQHPDELDRELTGFVGRSRELDALAETLESARLVTITGTAGVGKTRVAVRFAASSTGRFADGFCFAELGGLRDTDLVPHTVAACLGLPEQDARSGADAVVDYLRDRQMMLVLDTCEHVIGGCVPLVVALLREAPGVTVLATSRQPLDVPGEHVFPLPPLPVPGPREAAGDGDAVELFGQRAAAAAPGFTVSDANRGDVVRLCRRLDGIPLAIELAAVQLRATSLQALAGGLEHRFLALAGGPSVALPHQQTLGTAIRWSYDLCSPAEQVLWARLSVFVGSFTIPAAEDVCAGGRLHRSDVLTALIGLVDKSVVLRPDESAGNEEPRYRLLETIGEFGAELLADTGEQAAVRGRHIAYLLGLAREFARHDKDGDQLRRFRALRDEHPNLRAALGYALGPAAAAADPRLAARLAAALRPYWEISGRLREGRHWTDKILPRLAAADPERGWLLLTRGVLAIFQGELSDATADLDACIALTAAGGGLVCALGYTYRCLALVFSGRHAEAEAAGAEAEERLNAVGHVSGLASLDIHLGYLYLLSGKPDKAIERCARGLRRLDAGERWARSYLQVITALGLFLQGDNEASAAAARESLRMKDEVGDITGIAYCLEMLAFLAAAQERYKRAAWLLGAADTLWTRTGKRLGGTAEMEGFHQHAERTARDGLGVSQYEKLFGDGAARELSVTVDLAGSDTDRLPPVSRSSLTRREQEIAVLVSQGLTNAQIAGRLVVSRRTVDAHVASVYAKLGVSSRVQLTSLLGQRPDSAGPAFGSGARPG